MSWSNAFSGAASGAGAGALVGLPAGGIGAIPASIIGGATGFLSGLFTGNKPKDDGLDLSAILKDVQKNSTDANGRATQYADLSAETLAPVLSYFKNLVGGDPNAIAAATRPERARVIDQYDTARKAIASFAPRGGGANAAQATSQFQQADELSNIGANARTNAVNQSSELGKALAGLGISEQQLASADLNTLVQSVLAKRGQNMQTEAGIGEALGSLLGLYLTRNGGGGGTDSTASNVRSSVANIAKQVA